jgi:uncharacterized protein
MDNPIQVDLGRVAQDLQIRRVQVESVVQLLDDGNTVPFITRYRKERTGNLNEVTIREIQLRVQRLRDLAERKETILKAIEAQGKLSPDLASAIRAADNPKRLEDLYLPFKPKKRTKASDARDRGLEPLAFRVWTRDETLGDLKAAAEEFVSAEKGVESVEKVLEGVGHILAEAISEMAAVRDGVRKVVWKTGKIVTGKGEIPEGQGLEYRDYFDYSEPVSQIPPHRVLAINRGDKEGPLKVRLEVIRSEVDAALFSQLPLEAHPHAELFRIAALDALDRLILPSMEREVRRDLTEAAEKHAVEVFARNLRSLLLQPPIPPQVVMAIDPGFRTGCKVAVLDRNGNLLDHGVIYPHAPQNRRAEAKVFIKDLVGKHHVGVVAIGNGTACRETEELIADIIAEGTRFSQAGTDVVTEAPFTAAPASESEETPTRIDAAPPATPAPESEGKSQDSSESLIPENETPVAGQIPTEPVADDTTGPEQGLETGAEPASAPAAGPLAGQGPTNSADSDGDVPHSDEHYATSRSEAPVEVLPPISGGAPDSPSEAELDAPPAAPDTEHGATALLDGQSAAASDAGASAAGHEAADADATPSAPAPSAQIDATSDLEPTTTSAAEQEESATPTPRI